MHLYNNTKRMMIPRSLKSISAIAHDSAVICESLPLRLVVFHEFRQIRQHVVIR